MHKGLTIEKIIDRATLKHGDKYDYSNLRFSLDEKKIIIKCKKHGEFEQQIYNHISGSNCPNCASENKKLTTNKFIEKATNIFGDEYDYSLVNYITSNEPVEIICRIHGSFKQVAQSHLRGHGCFNCNNGEKLTTEKFVEKAVEKFGNEYDYSLVKYINVSEPVEIICHKHGSFKQNPRSHIINGSGCPHCYGTRKSSTPEFIIKATNMYGDRYDYSCVDYVNANTKVEIKCKKHGSFMQKPGDHLSFHGCPSCNLSRGELKIREFLIKKDIEFTPQKKFNDCKYIDVLPFDFYLPNDHICLEYDGIQHFKPIDYFGGEARFIIRKKCDEIKTNYCRDNNIKLIRIHYNEDITEILNRELDVR